MAKAPNKDDIAKLTFEQTITELKTIVQQIEQGDIALAESLGKYERGMALIKHCRQILQQAEKRIEKISEEAESEPADDQQQAG